MFKTVTCECPKCKEVNCMNIWGKDIYDVDLEWFMCSFCRKPSDKAEWKEKPQATGTTELPSNVVTAAERKEVLNMPKILPFIPRKSPQTKPNPLPVKIPA